jgi:hypothetical protein
MSCIAPKGNVASGTAGAAITARQALKFAEDGSDVEVTPTAADTDNLIGWALEDAAAGARVRYQIDGIVEFISSGALDASSDAGKMLKCDADGEMTVATAASDKKTYLRWAPQGPTMVSSNGDVAANGIGFGFFSPSVAV